MDQVSYILNAFWYGDGSQKISCLSFIKVEKFMLTQNHQMLQSVLLTNRQRMFRKDDAAHGFNVIW